MKHHVIKSPRVALCRECHGRGRVAGVAGCEKRCPQCEGSGRVVVSAEVELDISPYKPGGKEE